MSIVAQGTFENYYITKARLDTYFDSLNIVREGNLKGTGYTQYKRWVKYFDPIMYPHGDFNLYNQAIQNYFTDFKNKDSKDYSEYEVNWTSVGPNNKPDGSNWGGIGEVHYIYFDPTDNTKQIIFACSPVGGLFRSTDGGEHWYNCGTDRGLPLCGVGSVAIDKSNSMNNWFVTTGNAEGYNSGVGLKFNESTGIYRTTNAGTNWQCIGFYNNIGFGTRIKKIISIGSGTNLHLFAVVDDGISNSAGGLMECSNPLAPTPIWEKRIDGDFYDLALKPNDNNILYVSGTYETSGHLFKYNISNHEYIQIPDPTFVPPYTNYRRISIEVSPAAPDYVFAIFFTKAYTSKFCRYDDITGLWIDKGGLPTQDYATYPEAERGKGWTLAPKLTTNGELIAVYSNTDPVMYSKNLLDNYNCIWDSSTSGYSIEVHADKHCMAYSPDGKDIWIGTDGGIFKNDEQLLNTGWVEKNHGLSIGQVWFLASSEINPNVLLSGGFDNGCNIYRKNSNGVWSAKHIWYGDGFQCEFDKTDTNIMYVSKQGGRVGKSINGGQTFGYAGFAGHWDTYFIIHPSNNNILYGTGPAGMYRTTNRGSNWALYSNFSENRNDIFTLAVSKANTNYIYVRWIGDQTQKDRIYKSTTGGGNNANNWINLGNAPTMQEPPNYDLHINYILPDENDPDIIYVSTGNIWGWSNGKYKIYKVNTLNPNNIIWTDISEGIPNYFSTDVIAQLKGSNYLFVSSTFGIMYKDMNDIHSDWVKISDNLPNAFISDIDIDPTNNLIYAGTMGRGIWVGNLPCFYNSNPLIINSDTIWDKQKRLSSDVIVKNGATLNIISTIQIPSNAKIIVESGGKLIVDGGVLTNGCAGALWQGIEVQGNPNQMQNDPQYQGYVELKNGAIIENALIGVHCVLNAYMPADNGGIPYTSYASGGIVIANNSFFKNNQTSINIEHYPFDNYYSSISSCTFEYPNSIDPNSDAYISYVKFTGVKGVNIFQNKFKGNPANNFNTRGYGIEAHDATFNLINNLSVPTPNEFINLSYGIVCYNTNPITSPVISKTIFTNCWRGVYLSGVTNPTVTFNTISVPSDNNNCYGLYLDNCPTFNVQENTFAGKGENAKGDFGIIINNCGETSKKIYNNVFTNLNTGTQAQNQNKNASGSTGLQILCNTYTNTSYDIKVMSDQTGVSGIAQFQGRPGPFSYSPAGNLFSHNTMDYTNSLRPNVTYYHHVPSSNPYVLPTVSGNITLSNTNIFWSGKPICCPLEITEELGDIAGLKNSIGSSQSQVNTANIQLQTLVDGGNTSVLETQVENSPPSQALQLRNKLLGTTPYLSDSVMVSAIDNEDGLPPSMLTQVLVQNPSGAKSPEVLDKLDSRENPLPGYMMQQILAGQNRLSEKEKLETKVCYYTLQRDVAWDKIARIYKNDSIHPWANDSLMELLGSDPRLMAKYELVFARFAKNQDNEAIQLLNSLPQNYQMDESQTEEYNDYVALAGIYANLKENHQTWKDMSNAQKQVLEVMANKQKNTADMFAVNIMRNIDNYTYNEPILLDGVGGGKMLFGIGASTTNQPGSSDIQFKVYPNPANNYFLIDYLLIDESTNAKIEIVDISGKIIKSFKLKDQQNQLVIETKGIKNGIYFVYLIDNGAIMKQAKLTIIN